MDVPTEEMPVNEELPRLIPRLNRRIPTPDREMRIMEDPMVEEQGPIEIEHNIPEPDDRMLMRKIQKEIDDLMVLDRAGAFAHLENEEGDTLPGLDHEVEERG